MCVIFLLLHDLHTLHLSHRLFELQYVHCLHLLDYLAKHDDTAADRTEVAALAFDFDEIDRFNRTAVIADAGRSHRRICSFALQ